MASVFLSYVHEDSDKARPIARTLERAGHQVWWDRFIKGGAEYSDEIEAELNKADFVIVLWSERSIHSAWVRDEAEVGCRSGRLVPLRLDAASPPLGFRQFQTIDLSSWNGHGEARLRPLLDALHPPESEPVSVVSGSGLTGPWRSSRRHLLLVAVLVAILVAGIVAWRFGGPSTSVPLVAIHAAEATGPARGYARDLLVKLGSLQGQRTDRLLLIGSNDAEPKADLIVEVGASGQGKQSSANLALLAGTDRSVLWSRDFQQNESVAADLGQSMAYTAAQVLGCALEEAEQKDSRLDLQTLKLYLSGCADYAELSGTSVREVQKVIPTLEQVTKRAPRFKPAWGKLLLAEAEVASNGPPAERESIRRALRQHLIAAQQVDRLMPEVFLARIALLPSTHFPQRMEIVDEAIRLHPDDAGLLSLRSKLLMAVGRMGAAVEDAKHGASADPLSPAAEAAYIFALAHSGRLDQALRELDKAREIWPGAASVREMRFVIYVRYVDPAVAFREMRTGSFRSDMPAAHEALLMTRLNPTPQNVDRAVAEALATKPLSTRQVIQVLAQFGREEELIERLLTLDVSAQEPFTDVLFRPNTRTLREDPRFLLIAKRTGLLGYWESSGQWPDFCFDPRLPYDCKKEAARLSG